ncbi:MAG: hypothetical protein ACPGXK_17145 [Phycisphaerae bacterium]
MSGSEHNLEKDIEQLISASLDGALSDEEGLDLNRTLIRDPEARRTLDEMKQVDEWSQKALHDVTISSAGIGDPAQWIENLPQNASPRKGVRYWWLAVGSVAAALAAVLSHNLIQDVPDQHVPAITSPVANANTEIAPATNTIIPQVSGVRPLPARPEFRVAGESRPENGLMRQVSLPPQRQIKRDVQRDYYGIRGSDKAFYWIEVDRTRTVRRPHPAYAGKPADNEM